MSIKIKLIWNGSKIWKGSSDPQQLLHWILNNKNLLHWNIGICIVGGKRLGKVVFSNKFFLLLIQMYACVTLKVFQTCVFSLFSLFSILLLVKFICRESIVDIIHRKFCLCLFIYMVGWKVERWFYLVRRSFEWRRVRFLLQFEHSEY